MRRDITITLIIGQDEQNVRAFSRDGFCMQRRRHRQNTRKKQTTHQRKADKEAQASHVVKETGTKRKGTRKQKPQRHLPAIERETRHPATGFCFVISTHKKQQKISRYQSNP